MKLVVGFFGASDKKEWHAQDKQLAELSFFKK